MRAAAALVLLLLLPSAAAVPRPVLEFLHDGEEPPLPSLPGVMNATYPTALEPRLRAVTADPAFVPLHWFVTDLDGHVGRLRGPAFMGLWLGHSAVLEGNLTAVFFVAHADGTLTRIANATQDVHVDPSNPPDPTQLVPPDPTDPQAAAFYVAGQALAQLLQPPMLFDFGVVDLNLSADDQVAVAFLLEPASGQPLPVGAAVTIQYDSQLAPSFVYVPWYEADPPRPSPSRTSGPAGPGTSRAPSGPTTLGPSAPPASAEGEESPGLGFAVLALAVVAAALTARRR